MKKMQNVVYVLSRGKKLSVKNGCICISDEDGKYVTIPVHNIESVVCFGEMSITTPFMGFCSENNVSISFLTENGLYYGSFYGCQKGNVFLRTNQYKVFENERLSLKIACSIIDTKLKNSVRVIEKSDVRNSRTEKAVLKISEIRKHICEVKDKEELRGFEGVAAALYFSVFDDMISTDDFRMKFEKRTRRPPENNVNSLLSFVYTLLENDVRAAVESTGLDSQAGFLHTMDYGKHSLILDMMEEYRAPLCDRFVLGLINRRQIKPEDFIRTDGRIFLTDEAKRKVINLWQDRKSAEIYHNVLDEKINVGLIPFAQARLMSSYLRGNMSEYIPFNWR